jgi:5'-3' exonuclease
MGVDGLHKFINKYCSDSIKLVNISELKGKSFVIDGMQHVYSQLIYMRATNKEVITSDGKNISHIHGLLNSLQYYLKNGIIPIFVFDGKSPDIKKKKIEERKKTLRDNLQKLKELDEMKKSIEKIMKNDNTNIDANDNDDTNIYNVEMDEMDEMSKLIFGTPPTGGFLQKYEDQFIKGKNDNIEKIEEINEEYKKIYKKSILFKDYFIIDWIEIITYLGLPVVKADGEADPLCSYILKCNPNVYGIISDDSDMLVFGSSALMRKTKYQNFYVIRQQELIKSMNNVLSKMYGKNIDFTQDNLVEFSVLLGTDYGTINLKNKKNDSMEILKYYVENDKNYKLIIDSEQIDEFNIIKDYYTKSELSFCDKYDEFLMKPIWNKPNLDGLKKRLLELNVEESFIDRTNKIFNDYYTDIKNSKDTKITKKKKSSVYYCKNDKNNNIDYYDNIDNKFDELFNFNNKNKVKTKTSKISDYIDDIIKNESSSNGEDDDDDDDSEDNKKNNEKLNDEFFPGDIMSLNS